MLTDSIPTKTSSYDVDKSSCIENYLRLADAMACDSSDRRTELGLTDKDRTMAEECLHAIGLPVDRPLIVLNTGAATAPTKRWPIEHAATTARRLAEELGASIVIHAGPNERETAAALEASSAHPFVRSMGRYRDLPLGLSKGLIARSYLVVSTDSGPRHIGVAFNKPVVSLFGSIDPAATQTFNRPETIVRLGLACQPCGSYDCRWKHADCMNKLDSERVVRAVKAAIAGSNLRFLERSELGTLVP